jgi:hypothetical protein
VAITHDTPAWLDSFAQTDMNDTFSLGISRDVYISVMNTVHGGLREFANDILAAAGSTGAIPNLQDKVSQVLGTMGDSIIAEARREHAIPLRRVLGVQSWPQESEQGDKWSFCLTAGTLRPANQERQ